MFTNSLKIAIFLSVKTLLVGNFGARNVGDEMILASALETYPDAVVMTADADFSQSFIERSFETVRPYPTGFRSFLRYVFQKSGTIRALKHEVDTIIFPGGGLFAIHDRAWWIWGLTLMGLRRTFPKARIEMQCQGIDRPKTFWQRFWLPRVLDAIDFITVRDEASAQILNDQKQATEVVGDRVEIFLKNFRTTNYKLQTTNKELILINARQKMMDVPWPQANIYVAMEPGDTQWVPMSFEGRIVFPETITETLAVFSAAKKAVGQRLHFLILAKGCGCPEVEIFGEPYAEKVVAWAASHMREI